MSVEIKRHRVIPAKHAVPRFEATMMAEGWVLGRKMSDWGYAVSSSQA